MNYEIAKLVYLTSFSSIPFYFISWANNYAVIIHLRKGEDTMENFLIPFALKISKIYYADVFIVVLASTVIGGSNMTSEWMGGYSLSPLYPCRMNTSMKFKLSF